MLKRVRQIFLPQRFSYCYPIATASSGHEKKVPSINETNIHELLGKVPPNVRAKYPS